MADIMSMALAPINLLFRVSSENPNSAILGSLALAGGAYFIGQTNWMALLIAFAATIIIYSDELEHPRTAPVSVEPAE